MQLLNVLRAQSVWLFDANDLNPRGKSFLPDLLDWLKETYRFQQVPKGPDDLDETKGLAFERGEFFLGDEWLAVGLKIYTDGLIANTYSSTHATDKFLADVLSTAALEYGLNYDPEIVRSRTHLSELTVRIEGALSNLSPKLAEFADKLSAIKDQKWASPFEPGGVSFWTDVSAAALKFAPFSIERKVNAPFSENRYYSKAPLHTDVHLDALRDFEQLLLSP